MAGKLKSSKAKTFVTGGKGKMFSEREAGPQKAGVSSSEGQNAGETQFARGGKTKMFGFTGAKPAKAE